jgi:hypothetical protein
MSATTPHPPSGIPISSSTWFVTGINRGLGRSIAEFALAILQVTWLPDPNPGLPMIRTSDWKDFRL